jgi:hypothetical protein
MGLFDRFGADDPPIVDEIVENAEGDIAREIKGGSRILNESLLHHLREGEQPHYILQTQKIKINDRGDKFEINDPGEKSKWSKVSPDKGIYILFTDQRILIVVGKENKDVTYPMDYNQLHEYKFSNGIPAITSDKIKIQSDTTTINFSPNPSGTSIGDIEDFLDRR